MNETEQILIRMGVDARAVVLGLNKVGSLARGWATSLAVELKGALGGLFAAGAVIEGFARMREEMLEAKRLSEELGVSINFIQSLQLKAQQIGVGIESLTRPLVEFNRQVGQAKRGIPEAVEKLSDMGVITDKGQLSALTYSQAMANLKNQFDKIGDAAKQDALLNEAFGNSAYRVAFLFRQTQAEFQSMSASNFFTKYSEETLADFNAMNSGATEFFKSLRVTAANTASWIIYFSRVASHFVEFGFGKAKNPVEGFKMALDAAREQANIQGAQLQADRDAQAQDIEVQEQKAELLSRQNDLLEQQKELQAEIADRGKSSIDELAEHYRRTLGLPKIIEYGVSDRERQAYNIKTLDERAQIAFNQGNDRQFLSLRAEADQLRAGLPWARLQDRNPLERAEASLDSIDRRLTPVQAMADMINTEHKAP